MLSRSVAGGSKTVGGRTYAKQHFLKSLDLNDLLEPVDSSHNAFTGTKLICSLGPSSHSVPVLEDMLNAGMVAARIDMTWGGLDFHKRTLQALSEAMINTRKLCAIVLSTLGREVMVKRPCVCGEDGWPAHADPFEVKAGQTITLTTRSDVEATDSLLPVTYPQLHSMCQEGDTIYIGRYLVTGADSASLYLEVLSVQGQDIICQAQNSAVMDGLMTVFHMERSTDSLLNLQNTQPLLSEYDKQAMEALGAEFDIDFVNLAYTRTGEDVREARMFLDSIGMTNTKILAKVETRQALLNFRGILALADGLVFSRGNIGLDVAPEKMAFVQKQLISSCNIMGKPVLITRVVDSMVTNPRPTRAEATDIANAVLDGVDGILLGAETLRGEYPVECVATIAQICRVAEGVFDYSTHYDSLMSAAQETDKQMREAMRSAAAAAGVAVAAAAGANGAQPQHHAGSASKSVAFAAGTSPPGDGLASEDLASESMSPSGSLSDMHGLPTNGSYGHLQALYEGYQELHAFTHFGGVAAPSMASAPARGSSGSLARAYAGNNAAGRLPFLSKLESLASSAVKSAGNTQADLIVVYTATGRTAQLVAKYRPPMPILTLVVPRLINDGIRWRLEGRSTARSCQLTRGLLPMLATPGPNGDAVLEAAVIQAAAAGLVAPRGHVVVLQQVHEDFCVKVLTLDATGTRITGPNYTASARAASGHKPKASITGALVDSDGDDDGVSEVAAEAASLRLRTTSSFGASPSIKIRHEGLPTAGKHHPGVPELKTGPRYSYEDISPAGAVSVDSTPKPASPDTPMKLGSADDSTLASFAEA